MQRLHIQKSHIHTMPIKTAVPQCGVLSPTQFNNYTAYIPYPEHRFRLCPMQMTSSSHLHTQAQYTKNTYYHTYTHFCLEKHTNLLLNLDKTTCTTHGNTPKCYGSYLRHTTHIQHLDAHKPLQIIKALIVKTSGKQKRHSWLPIRQ